MKLTPSREWLDRFLSGAVPTEADLEKLVAECPREDQHLDYKSGKILSDKKRDPADTVREYVAAFANSDGGTLLLGYDQRAGFDGAVAPGTSTLEDWVTRCIYSLAPFLSPAPRILTAQARGVTVLLIATARAPRLVPITLKRELVYYIRIGDSNFLAPPFLLSDLVLGRRNHPVLQLGLVGGASSWADIGCPGSRERSSLSK